ncbi:MAG TPA: sigma-54 dependent transcriptional regulator [Burkholderiales bacterium]|nr:sigma-54 dependent transcriptional regulator [Burkholderiales bacterium]
MNALSDAALTALQDHDAGEGVTLLAATRADMPLAGMVAEALEHRSSCRVRVIAPGQMTRGESCHAVVTAAAADSLGPLLHTIQYSILRGIDIGEPSAQSRPVLVHPRPDAGHYALALRTGIAEVLAWPKDFNRWQLAPAGRTGVRDYDPAPALEAEAAEAQLLGASEPMVRLRRRIARVAAFDSNVLLLGETGSGKECAARAVHRLSRRRNKPLISINCAALPEHLIESELFGYERGAFTGAQTAYVGKFGLADGGTLFLDEIGDLPLAAQAKILRAIEGHEYFRLGGSRAIRCDVRLIAATHRDLDAMCARGEFRLDLYFRLNVARIDVPALRERRSDILSLAEQFVSEACESMRGSCLGFSPEARAALQAYGWPGNVRELRNAVETALICAEGEVIELRDLPAHILRWMERSATPGDERTLLVSTLRNTRWNKSEAARELRWSRMKLYRKLGQYRLQPDVALD